MQALGIFEGGGAKGLAHVGAIKVAEERGYEFVGVAGTSAGAIVASLLAAGCSADDMYLPDQPATALSTNFLDHLDANEWTNLKLVLVDADTVHQTRLAFMVRRWMAWSSLFLAPLLAWLMFRSTAWTVRAWGMLAAVVYGVIIWKLRSRYVRLWLETHWLCWKHRRRLSCLVGEGGFLDTTKFEEWLNGQLLKPLTRAKADFVPTGPNGAVAFRDLLLPLKVIAADVQNRKLRVFSVLTDGGSSVAAAVCSSIRIPLAFVPKRTELECFVDGGIMSNFPAWVFDEERKRLPALTPTIGFRLVERPRPRGDAGAGLQLPEFAKHVISLYQTAVFGDNTLETRAVGSLYEIPIRVRVGALQFDLTDVDKENLYRDGKVDAQDFFDHAGRIGRLPNERMSQILRMAEATIAQALDVAGTLLRLNVMLPISPDELQVVYHRNMDSDEDCDDALRFTKGSGACGTCWDKLGAVVCDLEDAKDTYREQWNMDKYQQRLVRTSLKALVSVPVFDQSRLRQVERGEAKLEQAFLGVLNVDSDEDLVTKFREIADDGTLGLCAGMIASILTSSSMVV